MLFVSLAYFAVMKVFDQFHDIGDIRCGDKFIYDEYAFSESLHKRIAIKNDHHEFKLRYLLR